MMPSRRIGGVGTLYGSLIGAAIIEFAHEGLTDPPKCIGYSSAGSYCSGSYTSPSSCCFR